MSTEMMEKLCQYLTVYVYFGVERSAFCIKLVTRAHDLVCRAYEINKNIHMSPLCHRTIDLYTLCFDFGSQVGSLFSPLPYKVDVISQLNTIICNLNIPDLCTLRIYIYHPLL